MKKLLLSACLALSLNATARHQQMSLQQAIFRHLITSKVMSTGAYQGFCMYIQLGNRGQDSLILTLEAGRCLNSLDDQFQDILVTKEEVIVLSRLQIKKIKVKGYCCQASNRCPNANAVYGINKLADSNLVCIARYLSRSNYPPAIEQMAVWSISYKYSIASVCDNRDSSFLELRQYLANLKGEKLPWYTIQCYSYVYRNGAITTFPQFLKGKLNYTNEKENYATLSICDAFGRAVCEFKSQWLLVGDNQNYDLNIPIKGLAKGKYKIALSTADKKLAEESFEI